MKILTSEDIDGLLDWRAVIEAIRAAHRRERPAVGDRLLQRGDRTFLVRLAWMPEWVGLKAVTVFPENARRSPPLPSIQGQFLLFDGETGDVAAVLDGSAVTRWKTAADSALGAEILARPDSRTLCMVGAGAQAKPLISAHFEAHPGITRVFLWNRTPTGAERLAETLACTDREIQVMTDLPAAIGKSDIVCSATMSTTPIIQGDWLSPGTHLDLVGAYRPDMREADDGALLRGSLFVDARETTIGEIGELMIPMAAGVIGPNDVKGDLFDLAGGAPGRTSDEEITLFKNGGGAHLDLIIAALAFETSNIRFCCKVLPETKLA
jgi:ornithine cyclodeaminase/alanine dehydrogenase-like protein (mu-crystallin family)